MSNFHKIKNEFLEITVKEQGAELTSIFSETFNLEYLWQADPAFWPRHAPVLFPIVGKLKDNKYYFKGNNYSLNQHGFARDKTFKFMPSANKNELIFVLKDDPETFANYPFNFEFQIVYTLYKNTLQVIYKVINTGKSEMYFSLGGHPAFNCPLHDYETFEDYFLEFNHKENAEKWLLENGLRNGKTGQVLNNENILPFTEELLAEDALVFKNLKSTSVKLKSKRSGNGLDFNFVGFPYLGIWKKPGAKFICIEPWFGVADPVNTDHEFSTKEGVLMLEAGEKFVCIYSIIPF
jgi:galactose mutarotase-like enzyme